MRRLVLEFLDFLRHEKARWLLPIVLAALILGLILVLTQTNLAPFIYSRF